jgi:hypothetical protein
MASSKLLILRLTTRSSYLADTSEPAVGLASDTVQYWQTENDDWWRISTFAIDHDIHIYQLQGSAGISSQDLLEGTLPSYLDDLGQVLNLTFEDHMDPHNRGEVFGRSGLAPNLEVAPHGFAFWNPDGVRYRTQSTPQ